MTVIEANDLSLVVSGKNILSGVSFKVEQGEFVAIIGPNGAGKSTLLKLLMRIYSGNSGAIAIKGKPLGSYSQRELAKALSYVTQPGDAAPPFTVREFVLMGRYPHATPFSIAGKGDIEAVEKSLEFTGMRGFESRYMSTLSGGERQKAFIAAALAQDSEMMLLDEPTTFLDPKHQYEILGILKRLNAHGVTVLVVTHDVNHAALFSRRIIAVKEGRVIFDGPPREMMSKERLHALYDRRFIIVPHPSNGIPVVLPEAE